MSYLSKNPVLAIAVFYCAIVLSALVIWPAYRHDIQAILRTAQSCIAW
jgi:hypothetical protein